MDLSQLDDTDIEPKNEDTCKEYKVCDDKCYPNDEYLVNTYIDKNFKHYNKVPSLTFKKYKHAVKDNFHFFFKTNDFWLWLSGALLYIISIMIGFSFISIFLKFFKAGGREYRNRFIFLMIILGLILIGSHKLDL